MKIKSIYLFSILFTFTNTVLSQGKKQYYFDKPASIWEESIPLGNGRIGMMPWGGIEQDRIVLNEITMWSGNKQEADNPEAYKYLDKIRNLLFEKKNKEAQDLMYQTFTCLGRGSMDNSRYGNYQNFGNIYTAFFYPDSSNVSGYKRNLDLKEAISTTFFKKGNTKYKREYFTSFSDDIGVIRYSQEGPDKLNFKIWLQRDECFSTSANNNEIEIWGQLNDGVKNDGVKYLGKVKIFTKGGKTLVKGDTIEIMNANEATLLVSMGTNYEDKNYRERVTSLINEVKPNFNNLKKQHSKNYRKLFDRVDLNLKSNKNSSLPINKRLEAFVTDSTDLDLVTLYMQYGRYLLISSTREGSLPPNLQGLWAPQIYTPWNGDYHLNINLQMNLWGAEVGNLSELQKPLIEYVRSLVEPGENTARVYYNSRGWVTHILGNVWGFTSPSENPSWGATNTAGAWLCQHLWEHYLYTQDSTYLHSIYPIMKGSAIFFSDMLVRDPNNNYLVTAPTTSPENIYVTTDGQKLSISSGSTMDNQIIRELFSNVIETTKILSTDSDLRQELERKRSKLAPNTIGKYGQIMEWLEDYSEQDPHHRHVSQLYGLYPGNELTYDKTPELMQAAKTTLERRGDQSTGWSMAWKIAFWSRLKDGDRAFKLLSDLFHPAQNGAGTYPNLFSAHPPMQIDGNFGGSAAIMEMLLQSHDGFIEFIPALPSLWKDGSIRGLKVRGGAEVNFEWSDNKLTKASIRSSVNNVYKIKKPEGENIKILNSKKYNVDDRFITIKLNKNEKCDIEITN